jgi:hypothetical protein
VTVVGTENGTCAHDLLLEWASEMSGGSWSQWCEACRELDVEPNSAMRDLAALGHVEIDWSTNRFSCPTPTAAYLHRSSGCVFLTGARPRGLIDRLGELEYDREDLGFFVHDPYAQRRGPQTVLIEVELDDVGPLCEAAGLTWAFDPAEYIAQALPRATLDDLASRESYPPRDDIPRQRFNPQTMRYEPDRGDVSQNVLWSYEGYRRAEAWLYDHGTWWFFQTREYAPYLAHPKTAFLRYRRAARQLLVPQPVPLPPLQARAATLASGRLPLRGGAKGAPAWSYENVSEELAARIAQSLGTPLERQP